MGSDGEHADRNNGFRIFPAEKVVLVFFPKITVLRREKLFLPREKSFSKGEKFLLQCEKSVLHREKLLSKREKFLLHREKLFLRVEKFVLQCEKFVLHRENFLLTCEKVISGLETVGWLDRAQPARSGK